MQNDTDFIDVTLPYMGMDCPFRINFINEIDHIRTGVFFNITRILDIEKNQLGSPAHNLDYLSTFLFVLVFLTTMIILCDHLFHYSKCKDLRKLLQTS
jgi:hypothetical protein